jgi:hypothetical protein
MPEQELPPKIIGQDQSTPDRTSKPNEQRRETPPPVAITPTSVKSDGQKPPHHCEITYEVEKDWWEKTKPFLEIAGILLLAVYTFYTIKMYCANKKSADAATSAANTARDALVIGNRPWIKVDLWQTAPLEFLPDGSAKMGIQERIENVGSSVALRVQSWFNIFPLGSTSNTFLDAKARQKEGCDAIRFPKTTILEGEEMFPHDPILYSYNETISKNQIVPIKDNAPGMGGAKVGQVGFILAGCVTYRSSFEDPTVPSHETLFEYWIAKPVQRGGVIPFLDPVGIHPDYSIFRLQNGLSAN